MGMFLLATLASDSSLFAKAAETSNQPYDPRCEYLTDPLGIDVAVPRFSWKQADPDQVCGQRQTAYQLLVASSWEVLSRNMGDLWDSGKVSSSQSSLVEYGGAKLVSNENFNRKVRVGDKDGKLSGWSAPARFSMGLLEASDWKGAWIHHPNALRSA